jgi:hypothetical protein
MSPDYLPRAPRLSLRAPIAFRGPGTGWIQGQTMNISRSGVLFTVGSAPEIKGDVEFVINLSRGALRGPGVPLLPDLHCRGRVVRRCADANGGTVIAACIRRQSIRKAESFYLTNRSE